MTSVTLTPTHLSPPEGGWTADDLAAFPDDGLRYELVDGVLLVSAAPSEEHQIALANLFVLLHAAAPGDLRVFFAPYDVRFSPRRQLQPDVVVLPKDRTLADRTPLLVVEVLSPSTRAADTTLKRHVFEHGGVASYWLVDPLVPSLTVLELVDDGYVERATVAGDQPYDAVAPFPLRVVPVDLVR
jgi:Uma2 family endonuclease